MTGYQETLTDPSYHGQVVVQTAPHIGNTGVNDDDDESGRIWVKGYVVRDPRHPSVKLASNWRPRRAPVAPGVVGISGIDTRALTRHLRERGAMRVGISHDSRPRRSCTSGCCSAPRWRAADLTAAVTTRRPYVVPAAASGGSRWPPSTWESRP